LKLEVPLPRLEVVEPEVIDEKLDILPTKPQVTDETKAIDELDSWAPEPQVPEVKISSPSDTVHDHVVCDGCEQQPIRGLRFICTSCKDYNLCSSCESKNEHPQDHVLLKVKVPLPSDFDLTSPFPKWVLPTPQREHPSVRPRAHFVRDITIADGSSWRAGQRVIKTWSLRNIGKVCWPRGTKLVFVNGTIMPVEDEEQPLVPLAAPGEVVDVSIKVQMPDKPGRYTGYYRLAYGSDGLKFGHRIWLDVIVSEPAIPEVGAFGREIGVMRREVKNAIGKAFDAVSRLVKTEKPAHQENHEIKKAQPKEEPLASTGSVSASPVPHPKFQYESELQTLADMGFTDTEKSKAALLHHKGNISAVINAFLAQP